MKLFKRFVQLKITTHSKEYIINEITKQPKEHIKISFNVIKSNVKTPNEAKIEVYNLNKELRDALSENSMNIVLSAGYEENYQILFCGESTNIWHTLSGVNWITTFIAGEGFMNIKKAKTNISFRKGEDMQTVLKKISSDLNLDFEDIEKSITLKSKEILCGNSADALDSICNNYNLKYHISDNKVKIFTKKLDINKAIVISSSSGLLKDKGVVKTEMGVDISSMLIPTIIPGDTVYLDASYINEVKQNSLTIAKQDMTLESLNGYYKVTTATFTGDNYNGPYTTKLECIDGY